VTSPRHGHVTSPLFQRYYKRCADRIFRTCEVTTELVNKIIKTHLRPFYYKIDKRYFGERRYICICIVHMYIDFVYLSHLHTLGAFVIFTVFGDFGLFFAKMELFLKTSVMIAFST
jgi:hypothetical protein